MWIGIATELFSSTVTMPGITFNVQNQNGNFHPWPGQAAFLGGRGAGKTYYQLREMLWYTAGNPESQVMMRCKDQETLFNVASQLTNMDPDRDLVEEVTIHQHSPVERIYTMGNSTPQLIRSGRPSAEMVVTFRNGSSIRCQAAQRDRIRGTS
jgi:hypothetical protein